MREKNSLSSITMNNLRSSMELKSVNNQPNLNPIFSEINKDVSVFENLNRLDLSFDDITYSVRTKLFSRGKMKIIFFFILQILHNYQFWIHRVLINFI